MPLENLYEETDKHDFRFGVIFLAVVILFYFGAWSYDHLSAPANVYDDELPESLSTWRRTERVSEICKELPLPEQFKFVNAEQPRFFESSTQIAFNYRSERDFDEIIPTFLMWFEANRWDRLAGETDQPRSAAPQPSRRMSFRKNLATVEIIHYPSLGGYALTANYQVNCSYKEITFSH